MSPRWLVLLFLLGCLALAGCGPKNAPAGIDLALQPSFRLGEQNFPGEPGGVAGAATILGVLQYTDILVQANAAGQILTRAEIPLPVRAVDIAALDLNNVVIPGSLTTTANDGSFRLLVPGGTQFVIAYIASTTQSNGRANIQVIDPLGGFAVHILRIRQADGTPFQAGAVGSTTNVNVPIIQPRPINLRAAGIANILDEAIRASDKVREVSSAPLRRLTIAWNPASVQGSDFSPVGGPGGTPLIRVKGGDSDNNDTDEFDDDVIHHEFGHYVANELSRDVSLGGVHDLATALYPTLAYSEGLANWFAGIVDSSPIYVDVQAVTGSTSVLLSFSMEGRGGAGARGITSQATVHEVLWDLSDGIENRASTDSDTIALTFGQVFAPLRALQGTITYTVLQDFLAALVSTGVVGTAAVQALLVTPENQQVLFTGAGDVFPEQLEVTRSVTDTCVTRANIAGPGVDPRLTGANIANRFFRFNLGATQTVSISAFLLNGAPGTNASGTNIDLFLLDPNNAILGQSRSETPAEQIRVNLGAGRYYIHVSGRPSPFNNELPNLSSAAVDYRIENN